MLRARIVIWGDGIKVPMLPILAGLPSLPWVYSTAYALYSGGNEPFSWHLVAEITDFLPAELISAPLYC
jgi:hypothetical protein